MKPSHASEGLQELDQALKALEGLFQVSDLLTKPSHASEGLV
jgi:hypothetical protein